MRVLILEDEPLIAMHLEEIVTDTLDAECVWASSLKDGLQLIREGIDFALLDFDLGSDNSLPAAMCLVAMDVPFCFVSGSLSELSDRFQNVPKIAKPFKPAEIARVLTAA